MANHLLINQLCQDITDTGNKVSIAGPIVYSDLFMLQWYTIT